MAQAFFFSGRLALLVAFTSLLTLTTSGVELSFAIEQLTRPLAWFGFPSGEFAMMLTIALRFIPVLFREMDKILKAQTCRGAPFKRGGPLDRARAYLSILVPLFVNSFHRALELATAMEIRGYDPGAPRGQYRRHPFGARDVAALALVVAVLAGALTRLGGAAWPASTTVS
jgi:energy-coupling factor transport system permease protein